MKGSYRLRISDNKVIYDLTINRNITVIAGDSGTGKSTLYKMVFDKMRDPGAGVSISCNVPVYAMEYRDIKDNFSFLEKGCVYILDESEVTYSRNLNNLGKLLELDNYFIIISRERLRELSDRIHEIYEMYGSVVRRQDREYILNTLRNIYIEGVKPVHPDLITTEDS